MKTTRERAEKKYVQTFESLGLEKSFEYLGIGEKKRFKVRCKNCDCRFEYWDDILRNRAAKLKCPNCNTTVRIILEERERHKAETKGKKENEENEKARLFLAFFNAGYSLRMIAEQTGFCESHIRNRLERFGNKLSIKHSKNGIGDNLSAKENAERKYRQKFSELGIEGFEYIRFVSKDVHIIRCKKCGTEGNRSADILKGKARTLRCRTCGNGTIAHAELADAVLKFYTEGHDRNETCAKFNITRWQLQDWAKRRGVHNGRTKSEILSANAKAQAEKTVAESEKKLENKATENGFTYLGGYKGADSTVLLSCPICNRIFKRSVQAIRETGFKCPCCEREKQAERRRIRETEKEQEREERRKQKEQERLATNPLGLSPYQLEREKKLDEKHVCKCCGREYTVRQYMESCGLELYSNPGYCSIVCKKKQMRKLSYERRRKTKRHSDNHFRRAEKLGLPAERGITKEKLAERDGLNCAICTLPMDTDGDPLSDLYWSIDHIVALNKGIINGRGGHTWDNCQLAHRICNSNKRDLIGKEWKNV